LEVYNATKEAIERAKAGKGPSLIECDTYRKYGHFEGDEQKYKSDTDRNYDRDPIPEFRKQAVKEGWFTEEEADEIEETAVKTVHYQIMNHCIKMFLHNNIRGVKRHEINFVYERHYRRYGYGYGS